VPSPPQRNASFGGDTAELGSTAAALLRDFGVADVQAVFEQAGDANLDMRPDTSHPEATNSPALSGESADTKPDTSGSRAPDGRSPAAGRERVLAAFARNRTPPKPATPQPRPSVRQAEPISREASLVECLFPRL